MVAVGKVALATVGSWVPALQSYIGAFRPHRSRTYAYLRRHDTQFEAACLSAGARSSGGVFACAALTEHELTGTETYYGITPIDTRTTSAEFRTTRWFVGHVPLTVPIAPSFAETASAAQASYDAGTGERAV
jgi:hypothetical protein